MSRNKQTLSRGQLTCMRWRYRFPLQFLQFLCSWVNAVQTDFKEEAWCSEEFLFLSTWCYFLPCVVLVFPTCKEFSSLGLAVSIFHLYLLTENTLWSEDS